MRCFNMHMWKEKALPIVVVLLRRNKYIVAADPEDLHPGKEIIVSHRTG
jgi:hypothetical protein